MRSLLKRALFNLGLARLIHRVRNRHVLTVLMFHRVLAADDPQAAGANPTYTVEVTEFAACLDFLTKWYTIVPLDAVRSAAAGGALPPCPLLITFDDGWRDNFQYALPALVARRLPALLFVATEYIGSPVGFWQEQVFDRVLTGGGTRADALASAAALIEEMKILATEGRAARLAALPARPLPRQMANVEELRAMQAAGIAIGGHGHSHEPLTEVAEPLLELASCRAFLAQHALGGDRPAFSFPHGRATPELVTAAKAAGFDLCFTSTAHLVHPRDLADVRGIGRVSVELTGLCKGGHLDLPALAFSLLTRPHGPA